MAVRVRLWARDDNILREAGRSALCTGQIARLEGFPRKKCAERLYLLHQAGLLQRAPSFHPAKQGKPEYIYFTMSARPHPRTVAHTIAVAEVRVQLAEWLRTTQGFAVDFYYAHEVQTSGGIIPDATLLLRKGDKAGLFFFEIDNGTEPVTSLAGYSLASKLRAYASYFDSGAYSNDFQWAGTLRGFRVALIVPSGRLRHVQHLVKQERHDFVLSSTHERFKQGFHRPMWSTYDGRQVDLLGRGEVIGDLIGEEVRPTIPM